MRLFLTYQCMDVVDSERALGISIQYHSFVWRLRTVDAVYQCDSLTHFLAHERAVQAGGLVFR